MGLDTNLYTMEDYDLHHWRKCWGLDGWLESQATLIDNKKIIKGEIFVPIVEYMQPFVDKMIEVANNLGYFIRDSEELRLVCCDLYDGCEKEFADYQKIEMVLLSFSYGSLDVATFADSLWDTINTFIQAYHGFQKAQHVENLILYSSR